MQVAVAGRRPGRAGDLPVGHVVRRGTPALRTRLRIARRVRTRLLATTGSRPAVRLKQDHRTLRNSGQLNAASLPARPRQGRRFPVSVAVRSSLSSAASWGASGAGARLKTRATRCRKLCQASVPAAGGRVSVAQGAPVPGRGHLPLGVAVSPFPAVVPRELSTLTGRQMIKKEDLSQILPPGRPIRRFGRGISGEDRKSPL